MKDFVAYINGRFVHTARARVSALDRGLLYGDGLFETLRIYRGMPFALDAHLRRIRASGRRIGLTVPGAAKFWEGIIRDLLRRNRVGAADIALRLTVTRGVGGDGLLPPSRVKPTILITLRSLDPDLPRLSKRGVRVTLLPFHPGIGALLAGVKTVDYLTALIGKQLARRRGAYEGIYCTPVGQILEGTTSNIFIVRRRSLLTPPLAAGILPGVTRHLVMGLAVRLGLSVRERVLTTRDLETADEAFLTSTAIEILPIRSLDQRRIGDELRPVTRQLQTTFSGCHP